jgi:hypothetical protein
MGGRLIRAAFDALFVRLVKKLAGVGRASLEVWPHLHIGTVIKRTENKRVVEITRKMAHGLLEQAEQLLQLSGGGTMPNTAFIERLNGTRFYREVGIGYNHGD